MIEEVKNNLRLEMKKEGKMGVFREFEMN